MTENSNITPESTPVTPPPAATTEKESSGFKGCGCKTDGCGSCTRRATKLEVYDWLSDIPESAEDAKMVEVQFKNTRKGYFLNSNDIDLYSGDMVAVEASPGHDIGFVTLTGKLVQIQMKKNNYRPQNGEQRRIYRIAKPVDIEKYQHSKSLEHPTMIRSREIAENLGLQMKIGDVEYQGDGNKAIFYYIADERVDFRQLIKVFAEEFRVRIEMKQIGARQEAGRIGGIGPCGRELCCSSWMTNFVSVSTGAARYQDISLNPQKLAGQCGKLKCCLNYEIDQYVEAHKQLPSQEVVLETLDGSFFHFKTDVFSGEMTYSSSRNVAANLVTIPKERVFDIIQMNKAGAKPKNLNEGVAEVDPKKAYNDVLETESITRFDKKKRKKLPRDQNGGQPARNAEGDQAAGPARPQRQSSKPADAENGQSTPANGNKRREDRPGKPFRRDNNGNNGNNNKPQAQVGQTPANKPQENRENKGPRPNNNRNNNNNGQKKEFVKKNDSPAEN